MDTDTHSLRARGHRDVVRNKVNMEARQIRTNCDPEVTRTLEMRVT
jgi:hypothetical protein